MTFIWPLECHVDVFYTFESSLLPPGSFFVNLNKIKSCFFYPAVIYMFKVKTLEQCVKSVVKTRELR